MDKPQPKELVISSVVLGLLKITVATEDARYWIEREAPGFGDLIPPRPACGRSYYLLDIAVVYDADEVLRYLQSYNENAGADEQEQGDATETKMRQGNAAV